MNLKSKHIIFYLLSAMLLAVGLQAESISRKLTVSAVVGVAIEVSEAIQNWFHDYENAPDSGSYTVTNYSDYDGDGQLDYLEYYAGTDPTDGTDFLKTLSPEFINGTPVISWDSSASDDPEPRVYHIFRSGSDGLSVLAHPNASISALQTNFPLIIDLGTVNSQGTITSFVDSSSDIDDFPLFYRVFLAKPEPQELN